jgi:hypothetical protein
MDTCVRSTHFTFYGCVQPICPLLLFPCGCEEAALFGEKELNSDIIWIAQARVVMRTRIVETLVCCLFERTHTKQERLSVYELVGNCQTTTLAIRETIMPFRSAGTSIIPMAETIITTTTTI